MIFNEKVELKLFNTSLNKINRKLTIPLSCIHTIIRILYLKKNQIHNFITIGDSMKNLTQLALIVLFVILPFSLRAQENEESKPVSVEEVKAKTEALEENVNTLVTDVAGLKKIKISGYLQAQFEKTENAKGLYANPYNANDDEIQARFRIRRSRIKVAYDAGSTQAVIQGDFSNNGFAIKDAYLEFTEPWTKYFSLKTGIFNRPNFEVEYSSSQRESMERSAIVRALYPDERDLGMMLTFEPEDLFKLQLAGFNNTFRGDIVQPAGPNFNSEPLYFMARITKSLTFTDLGLGVDFGVHARYGNMIAPKNAGYVIEADQAVPLLKTYNTWQTTTTTKAHSGADASALTKLDANAKIGRSWFGFEAQLYWDFLGGMKLMGEYIMGSDVNEFSSSDTLSIASRAIKAKDSTNTKFDTTYSYSKTNMFVRKRDFNGFYVMLVKNITSEFQVAVKYDSYSSNAKITDAMVNNTAELPVSTIGFGIHNYTFPNVRLSLWYDINNVKTNNNNLEIDPAKPAKPLMSANLPKNLLTFRLQYKF